MIFLEVESAILVGGEGCYRVGFIHLTGCVCLGVVGELHNNTVVCWMCVNVWRVEMAVRWKIDKRETDGIQNSKMIFLLSAEPEGCEIATLSLAWREFC